MGTGFGYHVVHFWTATNGSCNNPGCVGNPLRCVSAWIILSDVSGEDRKRRRRDRSYQIQWTIEFDRCQAKLV